MRRSVMAALGAVVMTAALSVVTATPAAAYSPGTATAHKPTYNVDAGGYQYWCSYAHWRSGAKVIWTCELWEVPPQTGKEVKIASHTGNWTPPPATKTTAKWTRKLNVGQGKLCTVARGLSVDGGVATKLTCQG